MKRPEAKSAEAEVASLLARVGQNLRLARKRVRLSREGLAKKSGVSQRYLASIETGKGNVSIALLLRVALALGLQPETLLGQVPKGRARRVCLIGLRGAGKSTLGARAAKAMGVPFVEMNREIEAEAGMAANEVIALYGQEGYRRLEARALDRIIERHESVILAVAGGIVADPQTFAKLLESFHTIWLKATPQDHMARVRAQGDTRPMQGKPEAMRQLRQILLSRDHLYAQAEARLNTSGKTVDQSQAELVREIRALL